MTLKMHRLFLQRPAEGAVTSHSCHVGARRDQRKSITHLTKDALMYERYYLSDYSSLEISLPFILNYSLFIPASESFSIYKCFQTTLEQQDMDNCLFCKCKIQPYVKLPKMFRSLAYQQKNVINKKDQIQEHFGFKNYLENLNLPQIIKNLFLFIWMRLCGWTTLYSRC